MRWTLRAAGRAVWLLELVGLAGCSYGPPAADPKSVSLKSHPTEIIDVSGVMAAPLRVDRLRLVYRSHSPLPACNSFDGFPDGGPYPRHFDVDVPMIETAGQLTAHIAVDRDAGVCGWRLWTIAAVIQDEDRAVIQQVIASAVETAAGLPRPATDVPPDRMIAYCGYTTPNFSCGGASAGDKRYTPVLFDSVHHDVKFDLRLGQYPPPPGYRPPCRNLDGSLSNPPCPPNGR
jgi:hypothetical protein